MQCVKENYFKFYDCVVPCNYWQVTFQIRGEETAPLFGYLIDFVKYQSESFTY